MSDRISLSLFALAVGIGTCSVGAVSAGDLSWTSAQVSPALNRQDQATSVIYRDTKAMDRILPGSTITAVYANRSFAGDALVHTQLCWNGQTRCVDVNGQHVNTAAFNGLDPSKPMYLVHRVLGWGTSFPPLYVVGNVSVWFAPTRP